MIKIIIFFVLILFSKNIFAKDYFYQCGNILYDSFYIKDNWPSKDEAFFKSYSKNYWLEAEEVKITKKEFLLKGVVLEEGTYITLVSPIIINIKYDREKKESKKILVDGEFLLKNGKRLKKMIPGTCIIVDLLLQLNL